MRTCERLLPLLYRVAEGEASPDEAMSVARHLGDCTGCKIVLAREHRLARMLNEDLPDVPVSEDFVRSVMSTIPEGPPPPRSKKQWRGLKLASFTGLLALMLSVLSRQVSLAAGGAPGARLPRLDLESGEGLLQSLVVLARMVLMALESVGSWLPLHVSPSTAGLTLLTGFLLATLLGFAAASSVVALAAGSLVRLTR